MITEKTLVQQLSMAAYVVETIHEKAGLQALGDLANINESLEQYIESILDDLLYRAGEHDPAHGIDSKWLYDLVDEIKEEREHENWAA